MGVSGTMPPGFGPSCAGNDPGNLFFEQSFFFIICKSLHMNQKYYIWDGGKE